MTRWSFDPEPPPDELVTIRVFKSQAEYLVARSVLESADIECFSRDEHAARMHAHFHKGSDSSGTALQVRKADADDALAILDAPPLGENYVIEE